MQKRRRPRGHRVSGLWLVAWSLQVGTWASERCSLSHTPHAGVPMSPGSSLPTPTPPGPTSSRLCHPQTRNQMATEIGPLGL